METDANITKCRWGQLFITSSKVDPLVQHQINTCYVSGLNQQAGFPWGLLLITARAGSNTLFFPPDLARSALSLCNRTRFFAHLEFPAVGHVWIRNCAYGANLHLEEGGNAC